MPDGRGLTNIESPFLSISEILFIRSRDSDDFLTGKNVLYCSFCLRGKNPGLLLLFSIYLCDVFM